MIVASPKWLDWDPTHIVSNPGKFEKEPGYYRAVWYGFHPKGKPQESIHASMVELSRDAFIVTEYTHVSEWYMDEPYDPEEHGDFWRTQSVEFDPEFVRKVFRRAVRKDRRFVMPRDPLTTAGWVASLGYAFIGYGGPGVEEGEEEFLP